jgi:signal transduction histidine kinase
VRDIARAHGGDVTLRNRPIRGLEAVLTLPRIA